MVLDAQLQNPPGPARSRCACHLNGLPKPPVFFRVIPLPNPFACTNTDVLARGVCRLIMRVPFLHPNQIRCSCMSVRG